MKYPDSSLNLPALEQAIERHTLTIDLDTLAIDAIAMMGISQTNQAITSLSEMDFLRRENQAGKQGLTSNDSCILVTKSSQILGIFTGRDVVRSVATGKLDQNQVKIGELMTQPVITLKISEAQDLFTPLWFFRQYKTIVDNEGNLLGIVTPGSILQALQPTNLLRLGVVSEVMNKNLLCANRATSVLNLTRLMTENQVRCVVITEVIENREIPLGMIAEQKIFQSLTLGLDLAKTPAASVMRRLECELASTHSLLYAYQQMQSERRERLLVTERWGDALGIPLGMITQMELLRSLEPVQIYRKLKRAQQSVRQLEVEKTELLRTRNAELEKQVQERTTQLRNALAKVEQQAKLAALINQIVQAMRGTLVLDEIFQTTVNQLHEALNVSRCLIFRPNCHHLMNVRYVSEATFQGESLLGIECDFYRHYHGELIQGEPVILPRIDCSVAAEIQSAAKQCQIRAILIVPLIYQQCYIGAISLHECDREREWTADEVAFVKAIADHCAIAIHQAELYQQLQTELQERQKVEAALPEQKQFLRTIIYPIPNLIFVKNWSGRYILINQACADSYGTTIANMLEKKRSYFYPNKPENEQFLADDREVMSSLKPKFIRQESITTNTGEIRWLQTIKKPLISGDGKVVQVLGVATDITERKLAEQALQESERILSAIFNNTFQLTQLLTPEGILLKANQASLDFAGLLATDVVGRLFWETPWWRISPSTEERLQKAIAAAANGEFVRYQEKILGADHSIATIDFSLKPVFDETDQVMYLIAEGRDITQLKQTQAERDRFFNYATDLMAIFDSQGYFKLVNPAWSETLGFTKEELEGKHYTEFIHPDDLEFTRKISQAQILDNKPVIGLENRYLDKKGTYKWLSWNAVVSHTEGLIYGFARDITDRKHTELALRASEARFRSLSESSPVGIFMCDVERRLTYTNPRCQAICGFTFKKALSEDWAKFIHPEEQQTLLNNWINYVGNQHLREYYDEHRFQHKDGTIRWVQVRTAPLFLDQNQLIGYVGTIEDITEIKQAQSQIKHSLEEKEILFKEVHHRVKNNLQVIYSLLDLQSQEIQDTRILEMFQSSQTRIKTMALIHEKLYQSENMALINFAEYVDTLTNYLMQAYAINPDQINLQLHLDNVSLNIDTAITCGLIINELVVNALKYAFPGNQAGTVLVEFQKKEHQFYLRVKDNGVSLPNLNAEPQKKCLGLKLVNILVNQLEGEIEIVQNHGKEFVIRFGEV